MKDLLTSFKNYLAHQNLDKYQLAGFEKLPVIDNSELRSTKIYPENGDLVVVDKRNYTGVYGVFKESGDLLKIKLKEPLKFAVDEGIDSLKLKITSKKLLSRYDFLFDEFDLKEVDLDADTKLYEKEKAFFEEDAYLALYWLSYFGILGADLFKEVLQAIEALELTKKLKFMDGTLHFFVKAREEKLNLEDENLDEKQEVESALDDLIDLLSESMEVYYRESDMEKVINSLSECKNPLAKDWLQNRFENRDWIDQFRGYYFKEQPLEHLLKDVMGFALENIAYYENKN